ncbi:DUF2927 domain-containing protein [Paracoccus homiensis]|uniref:DUF2927 domain-containing protein n=1 Tax=Paracoccus homiensis TaxID=364199 RepID=A0A1I0EAZ8_9RHOB|nr:DUF2927 domain-containing protein [Paracoccus homiensis]SET41916.1 Protein of unknown function [Paracoccus homiensis]
MRTRSPLHGLGAISLLALLALTACTPDTSGGIELVPPPIQRPDDLATDAPDQAQIRKARAERNRAINAAAAATTPSTSSLVQQEYYSRVESRLLSQGRLRRDRIPQDAPIDAEQLAQNFIRIALRSEYDLKGGGRLSGSQQASPLRRWQDPVRIQLHFGNSADRAAQARVRDEVATYAGRLGRISGHDVALSGGKGNFLVMVLNEDDRRQIDAPLARMVPDLPSGDVAALRDLSPSNMCTVFAYSRGNGDRYAQAVAVIRAELPPLLRLSCIHEELAQGLGLANDSPQVRPSIFNDDEEFALLTRHDELLLQILYDPRLQPGMSEAEATPIVRQIARELLPSQT